MRGYEEADSIALQELRPGFRLAEAFPVHSSESESFERTERDAQGRIRGSACWNDQKIFAREV